MYCLEVFYPGETSPREVVRIANASEVLRRLPDVLAGNAGCERITVVSGGARLFSVDGAGNRAPF